MKNLYELVSNCLTGLHGLGSGWLLFRANQAVNLSSFTDILGFFLVIGALTYWGADIPPKILAKDTSMRFKLSGIYLLTLIISAIVTWAVMAFTA